MLLMLIMMIMMMGTMMLLMLPMMMMMTMMILEMKIVLRVLVTMMRFRTCLHKDNCNVFSGIKFEQFNTFISTLNW